jgi:hypothetical protein
MARISTRKEMPSSLMRLGSFGRRPSASNKRKLQEPSNSQGS